MSHYSKQLTDVCPCSIEHDLRFICNNPHRRVWLREPHGCERALGQPEYVSQLVRVSVNAPMGSQRLCTINRTTFLFIGSYDLSKVVTDDAVDHLIALLDDDIESPRRRGN